MSTCEPCPAGLTNAAGDEVCIKDANYWQCGYTATTTYCDAERLCAENEYATSSYTCAACPEHSTNPAGDNPGAGATSCKCKRNYRVSSNACVPCGVGYKRAAGDDVSGADTECEVSVPCAENEYVDTTVCKPCPGNSKRAAGDDPAGDDTFCVCDENQYVENQYVEGGGCKDCPVNTFRDARDNPADGQTHCTCPAGFLISGYYGLSTVGCAPCPANSNSSAREMQVNNRHRQSSCYCKENFRAVVVVMIGCQPVSRARQV